MTTPGSDAVAVYWRFLEDPVPFDQIADVARSYKRQWEQAARAVNTPQYRDLARPEIAKADAVLGWVERNARDWREAPGE